MITTFLATLNPMLMLFLCIAIGFTVHKAHLLPSDAGKVMAKLLTWVFYPALSFMTMANYCTVDSLQTHATNILLSLFCVLLAVALATPLARLFVPEPCYDRGVYRYALAFANSAYMGDPLVQAIFGDEVLAYYKLYCLPLSLIIYTWGVGQMVPAEGHGWRAMLKKVLNPPTVAMLLGIIAGLTGFADVMPTFVTGTLNSLKACMGPVAMLLAGFTIGSYGVVGMLKKKKVYVASVLRLVVLPAIIIAALFGLKTLLNTVFHLEIGNMVLFLCFFATATPLGMNTVIFPEAYGGDPETGASMALISHTLGIITLPLLYALMELLFGTVSI